MDRQGKKTTAAAGLTSFGHLAWSKRTGNLLFLGGRGNGDLGLRSVSPSGHERVLWQAPPGFNLHDVASDGRLLLERYNVRRGVIWMPPGGTRQIELGWLDKSELVKISNDGRIVFNEIGEGGGPKGGVFIRPTEGGPAIRLGDGIATDLSPDGKWVLTLAPTSPPGLVLLPTGAGPAKSIRPPGSIRSSPSFSRTDGTSPSSAHRPGRAPRQCYRVDIEGHAPPQRLDMPGMNWDAHGAITEDGSLIVYSTTDRRFMIGPPPSGPWREIPEARLAPGEFITIFSPDRRFVQTQSTAEVPAKLFRIDVRRGARTLWKEIQPDDRSGVVGIDEVRFTRDRSGYAYTYVRMESSDLYVVDGLKERRPMIPTLRHAYNAAYTDEKYRRVPPRLEERGGMEIPFRLAETPVFLPPELRDEMVEASLEIFRQLSTPEALERSLAAVPARFDVPGCAERPTFAVTDFAVTREEAGRLAPKLIELQAFPTLYAFQVAQCEELAHVCPDGERLGWYLSGLDTRRLQEGRRRGDPRRLSARERRAPRPRSAAAEDGHRLRVHRAVLGRARGRSVADREAGPGALVRPRRAAGRGSAGSTTGSSSTSSRRAARSSPST